MIEGLDSRASTTFLPSPCPCRSPATTMSQRTALYMPSLVALPKPTILLSRQIVITTLLFLNNLRRLLYDLFLAQKACLSSSLWSLRSPLLGKRLGPKPSNRSPGAPGACLISFKLVMQIKYRIALQKGW